MDYFINNLYLYYPYDLQQHLPLPIYLFNDKHLLIILNHQMNQNYDLHHTYFLPNNHDIHHHNYLLQVLSILHQIQDLFDI